MTDKIVPTYTVDIYMAGDIDIHAFLLFSL